MPTQENDPRWTYEEGVPDYVDTASPHDQPPATTPHQDEPRES